MKPALAILVLLPLAACSPAAKPAPEAAESESYSDSNPAANTPAAPVPGTLAYDKAVWFDLLENHKSIRREVTHLPNGVEATTESDDPRLAAVLKNHTKAMQQRLRANSPVRVWDPVFVDLFKNGHKVKLQYFETEKGVRIIETSDDPETVKLLKAHAESVSEFVREGFEASERKTKRHE